MKQKIKDPKEIRHLSKLIYDSSHLSHEARKYKGRLQSGNKTPEFKLKTLESEDRFLRAFNQMVATLSEYTDFRKAVYGEESKENERKG